MTGLPATLRELVEHQALLRPQAVYALDAEGATRLTFGELAKSCASVCALLRSHGSQPGDTVSLVMPNGLTTLQLLVGAMHGGWCVNPVNLLSQPEQMRYVLGHSDCAVVFVSPEWEVAVRSALQGVDRAVTVMVIDAHAALQNVASPSVLSAQVGHDAALAAEDRLAHREAPGSPDSVALLMYTSGTTGLPKGVMLSQASLAANAHAISAEHALTAADRVLAVLPLYHINAFAVTMLAPLAHGGSLALPPKFSTARFWAQAAETQCTWLNVVPTMISYLLEGATPPREQTARLRFCRSASAALPPAHLRAFEAKFGIGVIETMGLT
ncbi:MAG: AMP-binding protein, partial [Burkholderiaceae bacterium]